MNVIEAKKRKIEIFSYIIGLISFILLGKLIGNNGVAYMAVIVESISLFVLMIHGRSADLIGRLIRSRRKKNQYKEAGELFKAIVMIQIIAAVVMMVVYFFLTDILATVIFKLPFLSVALKILTPVIILSVLQSAVMGYFQGMGSHMPTVVSAVFRQLLFLLFGLLLTGRLVDYGTKVSALLNNADYTGMYGAVGVCLAILIAEFLVSLFLVIVYIGSDKKKEQKKTEDGFQKMDSFSERFRLFGMMSLSAVVVEVLKKLPFLAGVLIFLNKAEDISAAADTYGLFFRGVVCLGAIPVFLIIAGMLNTICKLTGSAKAKENRVSREIIYAGLHYSWSMGIYAGVCMAVLAPQIGKLLSQESAQLLEQYFTYGAAIIVLLVVDVCIWKMLQVMGANKINTISLVLMNLIFGVVYLLLLSKDTDRILALCLGVMAGLLVQGIVSYIYASRKYVLVPDVIRCFVIPILAAGIMGLVVMLVQNLLSPHLGIVACLLLCLIISGIVYLGVLIITRSIKESEVACVYGVLGRKIFKMLIH